MAGKSEKVFNRDAHYVTPQLACDVAGPDNTILVRGIDSCKNWINFAPPATLFGKGTLELNDYIMKYKETVA